MLVTKKEGRVFAVVQNSNQEKLLNTAFCSRLATHCLNVKLRELNVSGEYDRKWFAVKDGDPIKQVGVIVNVENMDLLGGIQFFNSKILADEKCKTFLKKYNEASVIEVELYENVPKSEQKKSALKIY